MCKTVYNHLGTLLRVYISHYEKIEKSPPFHKYWLYRKISNYQPPPKVWVSGFLSVKGNRISVLAIVKKLKMVAISQKSIVWQNFKLLMPSKVWVSRFPSVNGNGISASAIKKKLKNGWHFININCMEKISNFHPPPPKFGSAVFWASMEAEYQCWPLWKHWKMATIL